MSTRHMARPVRNKVAAASTLGIAIAPDRPLLARILDVTNEDNRCPDSPVSC